MRVSIVVPLFNKTRWISRCLDSIARQSMDDYEIIVVDDGSDDGGDRIVGARQDSRLRLIRQVHGGEGAARNRGLAEARCDWVAFLDADDEWRPRFLEVALETASLRDDLVAVFTNILDGATGQPLLTSRHDGVIDDYFAFVLENRGYGMTASSTVVRREPFLRCGAFRIGVAVGADTDAWARLAWSGAVAYARAPLAVYHPLLPGSATSAARGVKPLFPATVRSHAEWSQARRIPPKLTQSSSRLAQNLLLDHAIALANLGYRADALRVLRGECRPSLHNLGRYWGAHLRLLLPRQLLWRLRRAVRLEKEPPVEL